MPMAEGPHRDLLLEALAVEGDAQRALLDGDDSAPGRFAEAARLYRASWDVAPPGSFGRLVGALKAAIIAGDASAEAALTQQAVPAEATSPAASYAVALAALVRGDDEAADRAVAGMRTGSPAFVRAADAVQALAAGDADAYALAVMSIVADFEGRDEHLTGVPIADTAVMLERLAESRGLACRPASPLLPAA